MAREFDLVVECCRRAFSGGDGAAARALAREADWPLVLRLARRHRVEALAWDSLSKLDLAIPAPVAAALRADAAAIAEQNLRALAESARLQAAFEQAGIEILFVKGLTLAALAYPTPFLKMGWDIDVAVPPDRIADAAVLLGSLGYAALVPHSGDPVRWHRSRKESTWHNRTAGFYVELHSRLADNPALIPSIGAGSPRQHVAIGTAVLPTLADEELFAYLCVHGASSAWFRLKWIADFAALLDRFGSARLDPLYRRSQQLGAGRAAGQALLLADRLFGILDGSPLRAELNRDRTSRWLAEAGWRELQAMREPTVRPLGTAMIHLTQLFLLPAIGFKASELSRQARTLLP